MPLDQAAVLRWMRNLYIAVSIPVLVWLMVTTTGEISRDRRLRQEEAAQLVEYIKGAVQQTERAVAVVEQKSDAAVISDRLVRAEVAVHDLYVSLFWYGQRQGSGIAYSFVAAYSDELRMMRERLGQSGSLNATDQQLLGEIAHDMHLIEQLYTAETIRRNQPAELEAVRHQLSLELRYQTGRELIRPAPGAHKKSIGSAP